MVSSIVGTQPRSSTIGEHGRRERVANTARARTSGGASSVKRIQPCTTGARGWVTRRPSRGPGVEADVETLEQADVNPLGHGGAVDASVGVGQVGRPRRQGRARPDGWSSVPNAAVATRRSIPSG